MDEHRKLGQCIEVYQDPRDGWVARKYVPGQTDQVHGGFSSREAVLAMYGNDPQWPVFVLNAAPSNVAR